MTRQLRLAALAALLATGALAAQEREHVTLASPVPATVTAYTLEEIVLNVRDRIIVVRVRPNVGADVSYAYTETTTPTGATLLSQINRGDFSTNSLVKVIYNRLMAAGVIPEGSVVSVPQ